MAPGLNTTKDHLLLIGLFWGGAVAIFSLGVAAAAWYYSDYGPTKSLAYENACSRVEGVRNDKALVFETVQKTDNKEAARIARRDLRKAQEKVSLFCNNNT